MTSIETLLQNGADYTTANSIACPEGARLQTLSGEPVEAEAFGEPMTLQGVSLDAPVTLITESVESLALAASAGTGHNVVLVESNVAPETIVRLAGLSDKFIMLLDANPQTDREAHDRGTLVQGTLEALGKEITFFWTPATTPGLFFGVFEQEDARFSAFKSATSRAGKLGRAPARAKQAVAKTSSMEPTDDITFTIDWDNAEITSVKFGVPTRIANFAARIVRSRTRRSKESAEPSVWHTLEIRIQGYEDTFTFEVEDKRLDKVTAWLSQIRNAYGQPVGTTVKRKTGTQVDLDIAAAIRGGDEAREFISTLSHSGWMRDQNGEWGYRSGAGTLTRFNFFSKEEGGEYVETGAEGTNYIAQGQKMRLAPVPSPGTHEEQVREVLEALALFRRFAGDLTREAALITLGYMLASMSPVSSVGGSLALWGPPASGKSIGMRKLMCFIAGRAGARGGLSISSSTSEPVMRDSPASVDAAAIFLDDLFKTAALEVGKKKILDGIVRLVHDGPEAAGFGRKVVNLYGDWVTGQTIQTMPACIISDEIVPKLHNASAYTRMLSWKWTRESAWRIGRDEIRFWEFGPDAESNRKADMLNLAWSSLFQRAIRDTWLKQTALTGDLAKEQGETEEADRREIWATALMKRPEIETGDERGLDIATAILSGYETLYDAMEALTPGMSIPGFDFGTEEGRQEAVNFMAQIIGEHRETVIPLAESSRSMTAEGILSEIGSLIFSGRAVLLGSAEEATRQHMPGAPYIGKVSAKVVTEEGRELRYTALHPEEIARLLTQHTNTPRDTPTVKRLLLEIPDATTEQIRLKGTKPTMVLIPAEHLEDLDRMLGTSDKDEDLY